MEYLLTATDALRASTQTGNDVTINLGSGQQITLKNTSLSNLSEFNFNIVQDGPVSGSPASGRSEQLLAGATGAGHVIVLADRWRCDGPSDAGRSGLGVHHRAPRVTARPVVASRMFPTCGNTEFRGYVPRFNPRIVLNT